MKKREVTVSGRTLTAEDSYGLSKLCFATAMGLAAAIAAVFTTMLPLSPGWRYFWLAVCFASFVLAMMGWFSFPSAQPRNLSQLLVRESQH